MNEKKPPIPEKNKIIALLLKERDDHLTLMEVQQVCVALKSFAFYYYRSEDVLVEKKSEPNGEGNIGVSIIYSHEESLNILENGSPWDNARAFPYSNSMMQKRHSDAVLKEGSGWDNVWIMARSKGYIQHRHSDWILKNGGLVDNKYAALHCKDSKTKQRHQDKIKTFSVN